MCEIKEMTLGDFNCQVFFPKGFNEKEKYPVIFHLHGAGSRGNDVSVLNNQAILIKAKSTEDFPFVIIMPQCREDCWIDAYERLKDAVEIAANSAERTGYKNEVCILVRYGYAIAVSKN